MQLSAGKSSTRTSTMTLVPLVSKGWMKTQKMSYRKHTGRRMLATCNKPVQTCN